MSFFKKAKHAAIERRLSEERLYEQVLLEIESGGRRDGLWAKALQNAKGHESEAQALYIQYRVQALRDENELSTSGRVGSGVPVAPIKPRLPNARPTGNPLDEYDANGHTPLMRAVRAGDIDAVRDLLARGANPFVIDGDWNTSTALDLAKRELSRRETAETRAVLREIVLVLEKAQL
ncbi:ankyrin repeat domain-containing protein [Wenzhouxiangella sp. XN24]|uniref:ankyrin repeat domain-containing protein n=1 Tax=Wenzhouxiangella sp. XN24 TaxID=2713569 RepID=UPI0013E9CFE4|nr:ankyrin repeat domain-containing protein [Wenzhouxiangella sp. XN24]NGX16153.1 ankyrin repeat domain-containing protein [Wenzhouxiangella sp. XN24]